MPGTTRGRPGCASDVSSPCMGGMEWYLLENCHQVASTSSSAVGLGITKVFLNLSTGLPKAWGAYNCISQSLVKRVHVVSESDI